MSLPAARHPLMPGRPRLMAAWSGLLGTLLVVATTLSAELHSGGLRWVPHFRQSKLPQRQLAQPPPVKPRAGQTGGQIPGWLFILFGVIALLIVLALLARLLWGWFPGLRFLRLGRGDTGVGEPAALGVTQLEPEPAPDMPVLRSGIERALEVLDQGNRDPSDAIVQAWLGLEETAQDAGVVRAPAETPTEFTSRILTRALSDPSATNTLLRLYLRTRFSEHPPRPQDVEHAREALRELVRSWTHSGGSGAGPDRTAGVER